ncbi:MAG: serine--tRNA ligase [Candidatus Marinimicrobia bacterium]|jgi:seryl-tRNA synthetase|nr:serine--tRNA ligase [Candidatus Neomarinimicrobiota bacterium]
MLDIKRIRNNPDEIKIGLKNKGVDPEIDRILEIDKKMRHLENQTDELKHRRNIVSKEISLKKKNKEDASNSIADMQKVSKTIKENDNEIQKYKSLLNELLFNTPNTPHRSAPIGKSEKDNVVVREVGKKKVFDFSIKDHLELAEDNSLIDFKRGAKIAGSGFPLYTGEGAKLERSIINFMLDIHTTKHGYKEIFPPFMASIKSTTTTGQLPKFGDDMYFINENELYLVPTAEVPVTNIHQEEILDVKNLPTKYTAYSACFRREAGSYGKDTRGLQRLHQFNKVELVQFAHPEKSYQVLEEIVSNAETILKKLNLPYRVIELCTGDLSFASSKCYDIELWSPATEKWLEVSSCSNFEDFQARRGNIKFRENNKVHFVHTLNGSGVATPRLMIALLENYQREDGSIEIPKVLVPYFGKKEIRKN